MSDFENRATHKRGNMSQGTRKMISCSENHKLFFLFL